MISILEKANKNETKNVPKSDNKWMYTVTREAFYTEKPGMAVEWPLPPWAHLHCENKMAEHTAVGGSDVEHESRWGMTSVKSSSQLHESDCVQCCTEIHTQQPM